MHKNTIRTIITPGIWAHHVCLATVYSLAGRTEDARAEIAEVHRINPKTSLKERFSNALRKAGLK